MSAFNMDTVLLMIIGIGIVFAVLTIIYLLLVAMKAIFYKAPAKDSSSTIQKTAEKAQNSNEDEDEIAAVIAIVNAMITQENQGWKPTFKNNIGGNVNEKLYSKDKWKSI